MSYRPNQRRRPYQPVKTEPHQELEALLSPPPPARVAPPATEDLDAESMTLEDLAAADLGEQLMAAAARMPRTSTTTPGSIPSSRPGFSQLGRLTRTPPIPLSFLSRSLDI